MPWCRLPCMPWCRLLPFLLLSSRTSQTSCPVAQLLAPGAQIASISSPTHSWMHSTSHGGHLVCSPALPLCPPQGLPLPAPPQMQELRQLCLACSTSHSTYNHPVHSPGCCTCSRGCLSLLHVFLMDYSPWPTRSVALILMLCISRPASFHHTICQHGLCSHVCFAQSQHLSS